MGRKRVFTPSEQALFLLAKYKTTKDAIYSAEYMLDIARICKNNAQIKYWEKTIKNIKDYSFKYWGELGKTG